MKTLPPVRPSMMATTHALAGALVGAAVALAVPELAPAVLVAGFVGGLFPDADIYAGHRKTLHFPVYYSLAAVAAAAATVAWPVYGTLALVFLAAAALHSVMDVFGGGLELRPWEATSDRAVFEHYRGVWHAPRRWIRYDGSPEDAALGALLAAPSLAVAQRTVTGSLAGGLTVESLLLAAVGVSLAWVAVRRVVPDLAVAVVGLVPASVRGYVPERFVE